MADNGLLYGLGQGLNNFVDSYYKSKGINNEESYRKSQLALAQKASQLNEDKADADLLEKGYERNPDYGQANATPQQPTADQPPQVAQPQGLIQSQKVMQTSGTQDTSVNPLGSAGSGLQSIPSEKTQAPPQDPQGLLAAASKTQYGRFRPTAERQAAIESAAQAVKRKQEEMDPESPVSKNFQNVMAGALKQYPQYKDLLAQIPTMSAAELKDENGVFSKIISGELSAKGQQIKGQGIANAMNARVGVQQDNQTAHATDIIDKHPLIQRTTAQLAQLGVDKHTLASSPVVTPQILHEVSNGIASAMNGGRGAGLGMSQMQDLSTLQTQIASLAQRLTNSPKDGASPEIKQQAIDTITRLEQAYTNYQGNLANKIAQGRNYAHNANATQAVKDAAAKYQPGKGLLTDQGPQPQPRPHDMPIGSILNGMKKTTQGWVPNNG